MNNIVGVIQARMGSSRFPNKMAAKLFEYPIIDWVIRRCLKSKKINKLIVATSEKLENDFIAERARYYGVDSFRGSENNVLSRFHKIGNFESPDLIVRICADNPLISSTEIDRLIKFSIKNKLDYAFNHIPALNNNYLDGAGAEIFTFKTLEIIQKNAFSIEHKEHVTKYIWDNLDIFKIDVLSAPVHLNYPKIRLDIDQKNDLFRIRELLSKLKNFKHPEDVSLISLEKFF